MLRDVCDEILRKEGLLYEGSGPLHPDPVPILAIQVAADNNDGYGQSRHADRLDQALGGSRQQKVRDRPFAETNSEFDGL